MTTFERPKTAQEAVLLEIRTRLTDGRLPPGSAVRPDAIGDELGVSAVPVREALRILEGEGQVSYRPHRGYLVSEFDHKDLEEIYLIRELLEAEAVRQAIPQLEPLDLERMRDELAIMENAGEDILALMAAKRRFHFALFEGAGMPHVIRILRVLWDSSDAYRSMLFTNQQNRAAVYAKHVRLMELIEHRDIAGTIAELNEHRRTAVANLEMALMSVSDDEVVAENS